MNRFVLTPAARADLLDIFDYISQDNPDAARRVIGEIRGALQVVRVLHGARDVRQILEELG